MGEVAPEVSDLDPRVARLLDAVVLATSDLDLDTTLRRVVEAACSLVDARYGALGVIAEDGEGLQSFVYHGIDEATAERIGNLPEGHGILGLLIEQPHPLRLEDLAQHDRSYGFPANHPPMSSFLGAPIRVRDQAFGNLYLTEKSEGRDFTAEDEMLVIGLAGVAGAAIEHARLYDDIKHREAWREAVLALSRAVMGGQPISTVRDQMVRFAADIVEAESAVIVEPHEQGLWVLASTGAGPEPGYTTSASSPVWRALTGGQAVREGYGALFDQAVLWVPIRHNDEVVAALGVGRAEPFSEGEESHLSGYGEQVSFLWNYARTREALQRLSLVEERERIGRDLHDTVIQRLFATGLSLQATIRRAEEHPEVADRLEQAVDDIDVTVKQIRSTIFQLQSDAGPGRSVRAAVLEVIEEVAPLLDQAPRVRFEGPLDTVVGAQVAEHLLAVVREALTNVAKHARAKDVEVELAGDAHQVRLRVADDGVGVDRQPGSGFGLDNLSERASVLGGRCSIGSRGDGAGTVVLWEVPSS